MIPNPEYPCPGLGLGNSGHTVGWIAPDLNTDTAAARGWGSGAWLTVTFYHSGGIRDSSPSDPPCLAEAPLPPTLSFQGESAGVLPRGANATLLCVAPLSGVEFQLRRGEEELPGPRSSTSPDHILFHLNAAALGNGGLYTCRYRLRGEQTWSSDSAPAELLLSDGKPGSHRLGRGHGAGRATALCSPGGEREAGPREGFPGIAGLWLGPNPNSSARPQFPQLRMGQ